MALPDLQSLRMLVAVRDRGSITAASTSLGLSQQAASARMRTLERQVGLPLFIRSPRGSELTQEGQLVAGWARDVLDAAGTLGSSIESLRGQHGKTLMIASSLTIAEHLLPRWLILFRAEQPTATHPSTITLAAANSEKVIEGIRSGAYSLGFIETPDVPTDLDSRTVAFDELVVVVAPNHPWARRRAKVTAIELAETPLIVREAGSGTRAALVKRLAEHPAHLALAAPVAELPTNSAILSSVTDSTLPAVVSILAARDGIDAGRLTRVGLADLRIIRPLSALWQRSTVEPSDAALALLRIAARGT